MRYLSKVSSDVLTSDHLVTSVPSFYFGFVALTDGIDQNIVVYNNVIDSGLVVEDFQTDGARPTDGHEHHIPVFCNLGIYVKVSNGSIVLYYQPISSA